MAAAGDAAITAILLPPKYSGRVIEQMMPVLPKEVGGGPSRTLTQGILWAALSVDAAPKAAARLVIQSQDARPPRALIRRIGRATAHVAGRDAQIGS